MAVDHLPVGHKTRTEARAERDHHEILHPLGVAVDHLPDRRRIGVVRNQRLRPVETSRNILRQRENPAGFVRIGLPVTELPQIRRGLDRPLVEIGVRCPDADTRQFVLERQALRQGPQRIAQLLDISRIVVYIGILLGRNDRFGIQVAVFIHETERGIDSADVDADSKFFHGPISLKLISSFQS